MLVQAEGGHNLEVGGERALGPAVAVLAVGRDGGVGDARALFPRPRRRQERRRSRSGAGVPSRTCRDLSRFC